MAHTPVIVGVADIKNRTDNAKEPAQLMLEAIHDAIHDAGDPQLASSIDSLSAVRTWTWPYDNLPALLAETLGVQPSHTHYPDYHGGNQPAKLLDEAALRIANGESKVAVITGGEALASLSSCIKQDKPPKWTPPAQSVNDVFSPTTRDLQKDIGGRHAVGAPIHIYPLYENGFRAYRGQSIADNHHESARLYAEFSEVAAQHPYSWNYGNKDTEETIGTVSAKNRMICFPYPLLMNAFNMVNLAAACVLTSIEYARELGIPENKWIYPRSGAGYRDSDHFWDRPNFYTSPAISKSLDQCLDTSGLGKDDIDLFDFYSCFPIVPKLACHHLGLPMTDSPKPLTVLGGLTSFGGAGNNYSMHAITEMTRQLRNGKGRNGLVLANGGVLSYQHAVCLSSQPRNGRYPDSTRSMANDPSPLVDVDATGPAVIETYTVEFNRDNSPARAFIIGRLDNGRRFVANHGDGQTLSQMASWTEEPIGKRGLVKTVDGRNMFFLQISKL